jgi:2-desacetyl-2-hydroxyethyl bacteriochlorophyllide A dehydrogenase
LSIGRIITTFLAAEPPPHERYSRVKTSVASNRVRFTGKQAVSLEAFDLQPPAPGEVVVRTRFSLMSTGTENIIFNRLFEPGTHWDAWVKYPFYPGYAALGTVESVGSGVTDPHEGQRVVVRRGHASRHVLLARDCYPVPDSLDSRSAAWFALAKIAFMGARAAQYSLGDSVLIIGAGPVGQMSVRWARAAGLRVIVAVDRFEGRLDLAARGGATAVVGKAIHEAERDIRAANGGNLTRVVIDGTGNQDVFSAALKMAADHGRVVVLGDTGTPSGQHLTPDLITRGLTVGGAHDGHVDAQWSESAITRLFFDLAVSGRFDLEGLISHTFAPDDCIKAYETANTRREETMGILFDWE